MFPVTMDDGPDGDDPSINDPEPHDDDEDEEGKPLDSLSGQDDAGMTIFNNLSITIDRLGFVNFYHRFIFNYSDIVVPLTRLTQKDAPWNFANTPSIGWRRPSQLLPSLLTISLAPWSPSKPML